MSEKSKKAGRKTLIAKREELINSLWGTERQDSWNRHEHNGWATIPRTMPHICRILDNLSGSGSPLSQTYLALWFRVHDEGFVEVKDKESLAYESGFTGQRAVTTWTGRMRKLKEFGFIDSKKGTSGEFQYVLISNPLSVVKGIYESAEKGKDERFNTLAARLIEVGGVW